MRIDKDNIKIILILLVLCLSLGYAYINSDLNINGTAQVKHANWDIHWSNIQVTNGSVTGSNVVTQPTISNGTTVNYSVILPIPGDYYEFTVDAVNGGQIDAMIDTIDSKLNGATITALPDYLEYTVSYDDGVELEPNHELLANTTETYKVKIKYRDDIELNQIPATNQTLSLQFTVTYRQATASATEVPHPTYIYTVNLHNGEGSVQLGQALPSGITQYTSAADAISALRLAANDNSINFYLKHTIIKGIVTESYVEFIVTPELASANSGMTAGTYTLRGAGETYNSQENKYENDSPYYESNKATLLRAFGSANCSAEYVYEDYKNQSCSVPGLNVYARANGLVSARIDYYYCLVYFDYSSYCG